MENDRPISVLMTADAVGGVWTYALELAGALRREGVRFVVAVMGPPPGDGQRAAAAGLANVELVEGRFKLEWMDDAWEDVAAAGEWLLELERRAAPDVVHLNGYAHAALPWRAPALVVGHSCVLSWWDAVKGRPAPAEWERYRTIVTHGLKAADAVVAPSAAMLAALRRHYGPVDGGRVIYNGADPSGFRPRAMPEKEPLILSAGRLWDEAKNVAALDRAAPRLAWPVFVAGAPRSPAGKEVAADQRRVRALGRLDASELRSWYARAAIYALPARYEPFGLSALEAAMSGCALVLGDIPSLREVWGDAARFVPPDDIDALTEAIDALLADEGRRADWAERALARSRDYTAQRMADAYHRLYRELIAGPARRREAPSPFTEASPCAS